MELPLRIETSVFTLQIDAQAQALSLCPAMTDNKPLISLNWAMLLVPEFAGQPLRAGR